MLRFAPAVLLFGLADPRADEVRLAVDVVRLAPLLPDVADRPALFAPPAVERVEADDLERVPALLRALERLAVDPDAFLRVEPALALVAPPPLSSSSPPVHLPDISRCAASATASAISEPSRDALVATLVAACCAVSAASMPASRILRRAAGLALIAAAAAASPAASISRLIAAFASLSTVEFVDEDLVLDLALEVPLGLAELFLLLAELFRELAEVFFVVDLAIAKLPFGPR